MSKTSVDMFVCDSCGFKDIDKYKFRRFTGNVLLGEDGGLIGNNIWTAENPKPADPDGQPPVFRSDDLQIYASDLCLNCILRILGIDLNVDGKAFDRLRREHGFE
jgi:hypothetical protein